MRASTVIQLQHLPLMYWFEIQDLMFLAKSLKEPPDNIDIHNYVSFSSGSTRSASANKLFHHHSRYSSSRHFYIVRLWNKVPQINLNDSLLSIRAQLYSNFWQHFHNNFDPVNICSFHVVCPCNKCTSSN